MHKRFFFFSPSCFSLCELRRWADIGEEESVLSSLSPCPGNLLGSLVGQAKGRFTETAPSLHRALLGLLTEQAAFQKLLVCSRASGGLFLLAEICYICVCVDRFDGMFRWCTGREQPKAIKYLSILFYPLSPPQPLEHEFVPLLISVWKRWSEESYDSWAVDPAGPHLPPPWGRIPAARCR